MTTRSAPRRRAATSALAGLALASVGCGGDELGSPRADATGDVVALTDAQPDGRSVVAPQVDLRRVEVRRADGRVRVDVELLGPMRPDGQLSLSFTDDGEIVGVVTLQPGERPELYDAELRPQGRVKVERDGTHVRLDLPGDPLRAATDWSASAVDPRGFAVDAVPDLEGDAHPEITIIR